MDRRLVALCSRPTLRSWIEAEIADLVPWRLYAPTISDVMKMLSRGEASRSELLLLDIELMNAASTLELASGLDAHWWNGTVVALGNARGMHRRYLTIDRAIDRPLGSEALRAYVECSEQEETRP